MGNTHSTDSILLDNKIQRDKLNHFKKSLDNLAQVNHSLAAEAVARSDVTAARKFLQIKYDNIASVRQVQAQLDSLSGIIKGIEGKREEMLLLEQLEQGNQLLSRLNKTIRLERVQDILNSKETQESYQQEISNLIYTPIPDLQLDNELDSLVDEEPTRQLKLPRVPEGENNPYPLNGLPIDISLRIWLMYNQLPTETQQIDKFILNFSEAYYEHNKLIPQDTVYILSFSILLLNTDKFNKSNKHKMSKRDFIRNTNYIGISEYFLEYLYDNTCFTPFIKLVDATRLPSNHPYSYILSNSLDRLRLPTLSKPNDAKFSLSDAYSLSKLNSLFINAPIIRLSTNEFLRLTHYSKLSIKLPKNTLWRSFVVILTGSQLLLYKNMSVLASIRSEIVKFNGLVKEHLTSSNNTHASLNLRNLDTPSQYSFKPDDIIPLDDSVALVDHSYSKHPNTITLHSRKCKYLLQTHSIESMHLWISLINYSAAFKWANVRIRGHSLSDSHLHYAGLKARSRLHSSASTSEFARASTATSTSASTPTSTPTPTSSQSSPQSPTSPTLNRVGDFDSAVDSISAHMHASSNAHSRSSKLKTKLAHLTRLQEENSAHLSDTLNKLELCGTLTPFRRSTRSRLNGELVAMLTGALAELRVAEAKYASVAATLAGDLAVEEKIEARSVSVGMRAAAVHSQASRVRRAQSMFVGEGVGDVGGEVGNLEGVQATDHTTDHSPNHSPDALQHTASIRSNRTQKYSSATSLALQEQDNEEYPSNSTSTTATSSNNHYGHISVIKMPDAVRKHARNWSQGGSTSKEIVSPTTQKTE